VTERPQQLSCSGTWLMSCFVYLKVFKLSLWFLWMEFLFLIGDSMSWCVPMSNFKLHYAVIGYFKSTSTVVWQLDFDARIMTVLKKYSCQPAGRCTCAVITVQHAASKGWEVSLLLQIHCYSAVTQHLSSKVLSKPNTSIVLNFKEQLMIWLHLVSM
jgi:hypothetical protein